MITVTGGYCTVWDTVTVNISNIPPPTVAITDVSCNGGTDGQLDITVTGGTPPYQYSIDNGVTFGGSNIFTGLAPGTYDIVVEDALGCQGTVQAVINEPPVLTVTATATDESCDGACDGTLSATGAGGTGPYTYNWDSGVGAGANPTGICDGTYTVTVTDANNCTATATVTVNPGVLVTANFTYNGNQCLTGHSFDFTDLSTNATAWTWDFGATATPTTSTAQNPTGVTYPTAGTYPVTLTASAGACTDQITINVTVYDEPTVTVTGTDVTCNGVCDGTITANGAGGTGALTYTWDNGLPNGAIQTNVCPGTYTVTVTDLNSCQSTATFTINEPTALTANCRCHGCKLFRCL